LKNNNKISYQS